VALVLEASARVRIKIRLVLVLAALGDPLPEPLEVSVLQLVEALDQMLTRAEVVDSLAVALATLATLDSVRLGLTHHGISSSSSFYHPPLPFLNIHRTLTPDS
jgi:hypothetical protein